MEMDGVAPVNVDVEQEAAIKRLVPLYKQAYPIFPQGYMHSSRHVIIKKRNAALRILNKEPNDRVNAFKENALCAVSPVSAPSSDDSLNVRALVAREAVKLLTTDPSLWAKLPSEWSSAFVGKLVSEVDSYFAKDAPPTVNGALEPLSALLGVIAAAGDVGVGAVVVNMCKSVGARGNVGMESMETWISALRQRGDRTTASDVDVLRGFQGSALRATPQGRLLPEEHVRVLRLYALSTRIEFIGSCPDVKKVVDVLKVVAAFVKNEWPERVVLEALRTLESCLPVAFDIMAADANFKDLLKAVEGKVRGLIITLPAPPVYEPDAPPTASGQGLVALPSMPQVHAPAAKRVRSTDYYEVLVCSYNLLALIHEKALEVMSEDLSALALGCPADCAQLTNAPCPRAELVKAMGRHARPHHHAWLEDELEPLDVAIRRVVLTFAAGSTITVSHLALFLGDVQGQLAKEQLETALAFTMTITSALTEVDDGTGHYLIQLFGLIAEQAMHSRMPGHGYATIIFRDMCGLDITQWACEKVLRAVEIAFAVVMELSAPVGELKGAMCLLLKHLASLALMESDLATPYTPMYQRCMLEMIALLGTNEAHYGAQQVPWAIRRELVYDVLVQQSPVGHPIREMQERLLVGVIALMVLPAAELMPTSQSSSGGHQLTGVLLPPPLVASPDLCVLADRMGTAFGLLGDLLNAGMGVSKDGMQRLGQLMTVFGEWALKGEDGYEILYSYALRLLDAVMVSKSVDRAQTDFKCVHQALEVAKTWCTHASTESRVWPDLLRAGCVVLRSIVRRLNDPRQALPLLTLLDGACRTSINDLLDGLVLGEDELAAAAQVDEDGMEVDEEEEEEEEDDRPSTAVQHDDGGLVQEEDVFWYAGRDLVNAATQLRARLPESEWSANPALCFWIGKEAAVKLGLVKEEVVAEEAGTSEETDADGAVAMET